MFKLIQEKHLLQISGIVKELITDSCASIAESVSVLIDTVHADVPEKKRPSYGRYTITKRLGAEFFKVANDNSLEITSISRELFENRDSDPFVRSFGVQLLVLYAQKSGDLRAVLPVVEEAANDADWIVRECTQGFVKQITKKYPEKMKEWYLSLVQSESAHKRRFVVESLRPVTDNKWMHKEPDFPLSIIRNLFQESDQYPRSSVGNSLSDWFRVNEEITWPIVEKLAQSDNENSRWIAYRACRNVIKKSPERVMKMLGVTEYKYKDRNYRL